VGRLTLLLILASLPSFWAYEIGAATAGLFPQINVADPYLSWANPVLLYVTMPITVLGSVVLVMGPGMLAAIHFDHQLNLHQWLLRGFALSLLIVSLSAAAVQWMIGEPLVGGQFVIVVLALTVITGALLVVRAAFGFQVKSPYGSSHRGLVIATTVVVPLVFLIMMTPKFFWESFNGDGAHAYEATRLLLHQAPPFWPSGSGVVSAFPGMNTMLFVFPSSWFMRLFGAIEASVRLPFILYLVVLVSAIISVAEVQKERPLGPRALGLIWCSVLSFALVMAYSATYDPYAADIALPATQDTLLMVVFLGALLAYVQREHGWLVLFSVLTLISSPVGVVLLGTILLGLFFSIRPYRWRPAGRYALGLVGCLLAISLLPRLLSLFTLPVPGSEHSPLAMVMKFANISVADYRRFAYALLPCGLYPVLSYFGWRRADGVTRALLVSAALIFGMYYLMASIALHYFVPAMILPLVAFWRFHRTQEWAVGTAALCLGGAAVSFWFALPAGSAIFTGTRMIGQSIEVVNLADYEAMSPRMFVASERLHSLFPPDRHPDVPDSLYGGSALAWMYYATRLGRGGEGEGEAEGGGHTGRDNYLLGGPNREPDGAALLFQDSVASVFVRSADQWRADGRMMPLKSLGREVYRIPRDVLFLRREILDRPGYFSPGLWVADKLGIHTP